MNSYPLEQARILVSVSQCTQYLALILEYPSHITHELGVVKASTMKCQKYLQCLRTTKVSAAYLLYVWSQAN
jgi:hypothetical protein